jgi:methylenetetrahydrofolate dehydrogenase (NADP+)/methenyltetrahydrofolate cyclohydrolase
MQYIDCAKYANEILEQVKTVPNKKKLAILTVGNNPASASYVKGKIKDCEYCGIPYQHIMIGDTPSAGSELFTEINLLNADDSVGGIIVQLPLPNLPESFYVDQVRIDKDVDGFRANSPFKPCTPEGIMYILNKELGDLTGKKALVIGRGKLVGEPIAKMLLDANCTVTVAHSKTNDLYWELQNADIIISAVGRQNTIDLGWCWNAEIVIDVGVNRDEHGKLCGDCYNFNDTDNGLKVTPVPGGIGLMTRAMLMKHVAKI